MLMQPLNSGLFREIDPLEHIQCALYIMFFKRSGSRHIHKEIKLQEGMKGIDNILCKTDQNLIRRLTYKCNTLND